MRWVTIVNNVDIETGEVLKLCELKNYKFIKKNTTQFYGKKHGFTTITKQWRRNEYRQGELPIG